MVISGNKVSDKVKAVWLDNLGQRLQYHIYMYVDELGTDRVK